MTVSAPQDIIVPKNALAKKKPTTITVTAKGKTAQTFTFNSEDVSNIKFKDKSYAVGGSHKIQADSFYDKLVKFLTSLRDAAEGKKSAKNIIDYNDWISSANAGLYSEDRVVFSNDGFEVEF